MRVIAAVLVTVWSGAMLIAQGQKISTPEELDKAMKRVGQGQQSMNKALKSSAFADVRAGLTEMRQALADSESFWVLHKKDDAVKVLKDTVSKLDVAIKAAAGDAPDAVAVQAAVREATMTCRNCHTNYRAQDADKNYILKPGTIGG
jgi:cytochrome c556